jgi:hypothetical protein
MKEGFRSHPINRREWLRIGAGSLSAMLAGPAGAAEGKGKWNDENIAEYTGKLFDWLKANFEKRAETLGNDTGNAFKLDYDYLAPTEDKKRLRAFERFAEGRLADKAAEKHVTTCLEEFERVRKSLAAAEAEASLAWKAGDEVAAVREGKIYDSTVSAARLTVVLDCSRSMTPYLAALRTEITRDFANAYFVEVDGCWLTQPGDHPWFFAAPVLGVNPYSPERHLPKVPAAADLPHSTFIRWTRDTPSALLCMVELMKTDAIYWFCDFDDPTRDDVIRSIGMKLLAQKAKLFVHTLDKKAPGLLATLAERSGGKVVRKKI